MMDTERQLNSDSCAADLDLKYACVNQVSAKSQISVLPDSYFVGIELDCSISLADGPEDFERFGKNQMTVKIHVKPDVSGEVLTELEVIIEGVFGIAKETVVEEEFAQMLFINGGASLYSIVRAEVMNITSSMYRNGKITIPMINMVEYAKTVSAK